MSSVTPQGAVDVGQLSGPLDHENADRLVETVQSGLAEGQPMVVLDMSDVPLMDSAGLDALMDVHDAVHLKGAPSSWPRSPNCVRKCSTSPALVGTSKPTKK